MTLVTNRYRTIAVTAAFLLAGAGLTVSTASSASAATGNTITVTAPSAEQSTVGGGVGVHVTATDSDSSATLSYSAVGLPGGLSIDQTGYISGTPTGLAKNTVTVTVTDGTGATGTADIAWQVGGDITVDVPAGGFAGFLGQTVNMPYTVTDNASGDTLTYDKSELLSGLHVDRADSRIVGWPVNYAPRWGSLTVSGLDGGQGSYTLGFTPSAAVAGATGPARLAAGGKCLDDKGNSSAAGAVVDAWDCNGTAAQKWTYYSDGTIRINGKCLSLQSTSYIDIETCDASASQEWDTTTYGQLRSLQPDPPGGSCLTDATGATTNGVQLQGESCDDPTAGRTEWTLPAQTVHSAIAGRCLDDYQAKTANGTPVDAYSCNGRANQNWTFEPDGTIRVNGKCLDDNGNSSTAGAKVQLWNCNPGDAAEQWTVTGSDNSFGLELRHGALCVTPTAFTAANGAQLHLDTCGSDRTYWHAW